MDYNVRMIGIERHRGILRVPVRRLEVLEDINPKAEELVVPSDSPLQGALAVLAVAEKYLEQEAEEKFGLNEEFFSIFGKLTYFLPPTETTLVYACDYAKAKEESLRKIVLGSDMQEITRFRAWLRENVPDISSLYEIGDTSGDNRNPFSAIDLRKDSWRILKGINGKYYSLHPELRGMMTDEEWFAQERRKETKMKVLTEPTEPILPAAVPVSIIDNDELTRMVRIFKSPDKELLGDTEEALAVAKAAGLSVLYNNVDVIFALYNKARHDTIGIDFTPEEYEEIKKEILKINKRKSGK